MSDIYLVLEVGYEGINSILRGFTDPDKALQFYKDERQRILESKDEEYSQMDEEDNEIIHPGRKNYWRKQRADRLCIQKGSETSEFCCVCQELGLKSDEVIIY